MQTKTMARDEAARNLAESQVRVDPSLRVFRVLTGDSRSETADAEPIIVLQVSEFTFPTDDIWPIGFGPSSASGNYPSILMEITPEQLEQLQAERIQLPHGWKLGEELTPSEPVELQP